MSFFLKQIGGEQVWSKKEAYTATHIEDTGEGLSISHERVYRE